MRVTLSAKLLSILTLASDLETYRSCFPLFDIDDLEIIYCSIKALSFTFWTILGNKIMP